MDMLDLQLIRNPVYQDMIVCCADKLRAFAGSGGCQVAQCCHSEGNAVELQLMQTMYTDLRGSGRANWFVISLLQKSAGPAAVTRLASPMEEVMAE